MDINDAEALRNRIGDDMRLAMKNRNKVEVDELRTLLSRISNAEALPIESGITGVEMQRKELTFDDIKGILVEEENEIEATITVVGSQPEYIAELHEKLKVVQRYE